MVLFFNVKVYFSFNEYIYTKTISFFTTGKVKITNQAVMQITIISEYIKYSFIKCIVYEIIY